MDLTTVRAEVDDGLATLTLARPDAGNAIDLAMARELQRGHRRVVGRITACGPCCSRARVRRSASAAT